MGCTGWATKGDEFWL